MKPTQTMHYYKENFYQKKYHTFALFDPPPKVGNLMTPALLGEKDKKTRGLTYPAAIRKTSVTLPQQNQLQIK